MTQAGTSTGSPDPTLSVVSTGENSSVGGESEDGTLLPGDGDDWYTMIYEVTVKNMDNELYHAKTC